jgi:hypothetical protein
LHKDDFAVGSSVHVLGRDILLYDCDKFTQEWYAEHRGIDQKACVIDITEAPKQAVKRPIPPHTGFGSEEDSMASVKALVPQPPKPDFDKLTQLSGKKLTFVAKMVSDRSVDAPRRFTIKWYLENDTMSIFEPTIRNHGVIAGSFLSRTRVYNPETGKPYRTEELSVGATITVKGVKLHIFEADAFTQNWLAGQFNKWTPAELDFMFTTLQRKFRDRAKHIRKLFSDFDTDGNQVIDTEELGRLCAEFLCIYLNHARAQGLFDFLVDKETEMRAEEGLEPSEAAKKRILTFETFLYLFSEKE